MSGCATPSQLQQIGEAAVAEFTARIAKIPEGLCSQFEIEAMRLEDQLLFIYRLVAVCCRDNEDLEAIASYWGLMVQTCDNFASHLHQLKADHPACGADIYYDRILDLRNKCRRLQEMHR